MEIKHFLEKLSSATPTPGGGSASALAGALSASLVAMVAGLSYKKGRLKQERVQKIRRKALVIRKRLSQAIDEDAKYFDAVMKAFRLPKDSEKERLYRTKKIRKTYQKATIIPQLVCQHAIELLEDSNTLILKGNPNAISDVGVAAFLADASLAGGLLNISINLVPGIEETFMRKMDSWMRQWVKKRNLLMGKVLKSLRETHSIPSVFLRSMFPFSPMELSRKTPQKIL